MAKHITGYHEKSILDLINRWPEGKKLTWDNLCGKLVDVIGKRPTRQSLSSHKIIAEFFNNKKGKIKLGDVSIVKPANLKIASQRIRRLEAENETLKALNDKYLEQMKVWLYNAHIKQISKEELNNPLPPKYFK